MSYPCNKNPTFIKHTDILEGMNMYDLPLITKP